jgi:hypothetical protein
MMTQHLALRTAPRPRVLTAVFVGVLALSLGLGGAVAHAESLPSYLTSFTGGETPAKSFESVSGVAVDESSGDVYIVDTGHNAVDKFSASGTFVCQITGSGTGERECDAGSAGPEAFSFAGGRAGVAVDNSTTDGHAGDLYVADRGNNVVDIYDASGAYVGRLSGEATPFAEPVGVAVDASGNVYVVNALEAIDEFSSDLVFHSEYEDEFGGGSAAIAVNATGTSVYVVGSSGKVRELQSEGAVNAVISEGEPVAGVAVAPTSGDVYFSEGTRMAVFEPQPFSEVGRFGNHGEVANSAGVAINGVSDSVYVADNAPENRVDIFGSGPTCKTEPPSTTVTSTMPGVVEPSGTPTTYHFEYGLHSSSEASTTSAGPVKSTTQATASLAAIAQPHQTYHYQLAIEYGASKVACEPEETLATPSAAPTLSSESVGDLGQTVATLDARINPNNEETNGHFQYGTSPSLAGATSTAPGFLLSPQYNDVPEEEAATSLEPDTTYYYRVVAENEAAANGGATSKSEGAIQSFLTLPATPTTGAATGVTQNAATIVGAFNPGGHDTHYYFEYSSPIAGGVTPTVDAGAGTSPVDVQAALSGLMPLTAYTYRLVVVNGGGGSRGATGAFVSLPSTPKVVTGSASAGTSIATLYGSVNPEGAAATYRFEYGTSTAYGASVPTGDGVLDATSSREAVSAGIEGLQADTTYHYRLVASNTGGKTVGEDHTLTTSTGAEPGDQPLPPGYSLTGTSVVAQPMVTFSNFNVLAPTPPEKVSTPKGTRTTKLSCQAQARKIKSHGKRRKALARCTKAKRKK